MRELSVSNMQSSLCVCEVSIIVPTMNEARNLPILLSQIRQAMLGTTYEVIVVDDASTDDTPDICAALSRKHPLRLFVRHRAKDGLSGAVLHGMTLARGRNLVVLDADLQHPPSKIPELVAKLDSCEADFVVGSRYVDGAGTDESWSLFRKLNSSIATLLAKPICRGIKDPMSGFFALRRDTFQLAYPPNPVGYKIALELLCKCHIRKVVEVPIHFGTRNAGESKLSFKQQRRYLIHLTRLYGFLYPMSSMIIKESLAAAAGYGFGQATNPVMSMTLCLLTALTMGVVTRPKSAVANFREMMEADCVVKFNELPLAKKAA